MKPYGVGLLTANPKHPVTCRDNLAPDIAHWRRMSHMRGRLFTPADLIHQLKRMLWSPYMGIIIVQVRRMTV